MQLHFSALLFFCQSSPLGKYSVADTFFFFSCLQKGNTRLFILASEISAHIEGCHTVRRMKLKLVYLFNPLGPRPAAALLL